MASNEGFQFKQFYVRHNRCAMKVGTDGVLLGAWAPTNPLTTNPLTRILDIGTGSGLIALMLAQRCLTAQIDAIDIDEAAVAQAENNFAESPWPDRLHAYSTRLQDWQNYKSIISDYKYHLIVSNPPYFRNSLKNPDKGREIARHTDSLSYEELFAHSVRLLAPDGQLALILPAETENIALQLASENGLRATRVTRVFSKECKPARRILFCFSKPQVSIPESPIQENSLLLENDQGGRSEAYKELTKDFYL